jgi:hypothetical protein
MKDIIILFSLERRTFRLLLRTSKMHVFSKSKLKKGISAYFDTLSITKVISNTIRKGLYVTYYGQYLFFDGSTLWLITGKDGEISKEQVVLLDNGQFRYKTKFLSHKRSLFGIPPDVDRSLLMNTPFLKDKGKTFQDIAVLGGYSLFYVTVVAAAVVGMVVSGGSLSVFTHVDGPSFGTPSRENEED